MENKFLTLYPDDFRNIEDWYAVCDELKIDRNALLIDLYYSNLRYDTAQETNIKP